jgi:hypothetical protein
MAASFFNQPTVGGLTKKYFLFIMRLWRTINKNTLADMTGGRGTATYGHGNMTLRSRATTFFVLFIEELAQVFS